MLAQVEPILSLLGLEPFSSFVAEAKAKARAAMERYLASWPGILSLRFSRALARGPGLTRLPGPRRKGGCPLATKELMAGIREEKPHASSPRRLRRTPAIDMPPQGIYGPPAEAVGTVPCRGSPWMPRRAS